MNEPRVQTVSPAFCTTDGGSPITIFVLDKLSKFSPQELGAMEVAFFDAASGVEMVGKRAALSLTASLSDGTRMLEFKCPTMDRPRVEVNTQTLNPQPQSQILSPSQPSTPNLQH